MDGANREASSFMRGASSAAKPIHGRFLASPSTEVLVILGSEAIVFCVDVTRMKERLVK